PHGARGRRAHHLSRHRAGGGPGGPERDGRRAGRGDQERAALPRQRGHSRQIDSHQAQRAGRRVRRGTDRPQPPGARILRRARDRWYTSPSALVAWALLTSALLGRALGGLPGLVTVVLGIAAGLILLLAVWRREWEVPLHAIAATLLGVVAWLANDRVWWLAVLAVVNITGSFWVAIMRGRRR